MGRKIVHWDSTKVVLWKIHGTTINARVCKCITTFLPTQTKTKDRIHHTPGHNPFMEKQTDSIREMTEKNKTTP